MALFEDKRQVLILIAAVVIGLVAAVMVSMYVQDSITRETQRIANKFAKEQAAKDELYKQQMQQLSQQMQEVEARAQKAVEDAARSAAAAEEKAKKIATPPPEKKFVSLAMRMPPGKRALTLKIDPLGAVGGLISPGDYVDIIAHLNVPEVILKDSSTAKNTKAASKTDKKNSVTAMIFQNIQILAINTNIDQPGAYEAQQKDPGLKITFAVTPEEASLLSFAEKNGKVELALRSPNEKRPAMISAATWKTLAEYVLQNTGAELTRIEEPPPPPPPKAAAVEDPNVPKVRKKGDPYDPSITVIKAGKGVN